MRATALTAEELREELERLATIERQERGITVTAPSSRAFSHAQVERAELEAELRAIVQGSES